MKIVFALVFLTASWATAQVNFPPKGSAQQRANFERALVPMQETIAELQRRMYEQAGQKAQVTESRDTHAESRLNLGAILGGISVLLVFLFGIASVAISLASR